MNDNYVLYADDTSMVYVGADLKELNDHVNRQMVLLYLNGASTTN